MAWQTPKTNWAAGDVIGSADLNRIEGDLAQLRGNTGNADPTSNTVLLGTGAGTSSWGQIADAYVASNANILQTKISNVIRAIDADMLDGLHGADYTPAAHWKASAAVHGLPSGVNVVGTALGSGYQIDFGTASVSAGGTTITFTRAFSQTPVVLVAPTGSSDWSPWADNVTTTSFKAHGPSDGAATVVWVAICRG